MGDASPPRRAIRVALVSSVGDIGDSHTLLYARTLVKHGCEVILIRPGDPSVAAGVIGITTDVIPPVKFNFWLHRPGLIHLSMAVSNRIVNSARLYRRVRAWQPDVVVATEPDAWLVALLARWGRCNHRVVEDLREIYEDRAIAFPPPIGAVVFRAVRALQRTLAKRTDEIIHMSPERQDYFSYLSRRGTVVKYAPDLQDTAWREDRVSKLTRRSPDEVVVVHAGSLRHNYAGDTLIRAFAQLDRQGVAARLIVLGGTSGRIEAAGELADLQRRGTIEVLPPMAFSEVVAILRGADIGVNLVLPLDTMHRLAQPRKLFEYFAAGLPVVVADVPTLRGIVGQYDLGEIVDPLSPADVSKAISKLAADAERRKACAARARSYALREGNWDRQVPQFISAVLGTD